MSGGYLSGGDTRDNSTILQSPFPVPADGKVKTLEFLNASRGIVSLLESFGKAFIAVKSDMNGNIVKLANKYNTNKDSFVYLDDMILSEKGTDAVVATDALLWLGRGLHFVQRFFELFIEEFGSGNDELVPILQTAYKDTLNKYHGWVTQQIFGLIVRMSPTRSQLITNICPDESCYIETEFLSNMNEYITKLKENVSIIKEFYNEHDLESSNKV